MRKKLEFQKGLGERMLALELENGFEICRVLHTFNEAIFSDSVVVSESEEVLFGKRDLEEEILGLKFKN